MRGTTTIALLAAAAIGFAAPALAQSTAQGTVKIPSVIELSGSGAISGTNWRHG